MGDKHSFESDCMIMLMAALALLLLLRLLFKSVRSACFARLPQWGRGGEKSG